MIPLISNSNFLLWFLNINLHPMHKLEKKFSDIKLSIYFRFLSVKFCSREDAEHDVLWMISAEKLSNFRISLSERFADSILFEFKNRSSVFSLMIVGTFGYRFYMKVYRSKKEEIQHSILFFKRPESRVLYCAENSSIRMLGTGISVK